MRQEKTVETMNVRARLLAAAKKLFADKGIDSVSVRDIVQAARANVSMVNYHFGNKEGLYRECLNQFGSRNLDISRESLTPPHNKTEFEVKLKLYLERIFL